MLKTEIQTAALRFDQYDMTRAHAESSEATERAYLRKIY